MVKICTTTPKPGQCAGVQYVFILSGFLQNGTIAYAGFAGDNSQFNSTQETLDFTRATIIPSGARVFGKILGITQIQPNPSVAGFFKVFINNTSVQFGSRFNGNVIPTNIKIFEYYRVDRQPDNCEVETICLCESTDQTITCAGLEGGICCISKAFIQSKCDELRI